MAKTKYQELAEYLSEVHHLNMIFWLLQWDQNTHMPPEGASARATQLALIQRLRHEFLTSDKTARLIEAAAQEVNMDDFDSHEASLVRVARADYEYAVQVPSAFVADYAQVTGMAFEVWKQAKADNDYAHFAPILQQILDLKLREAELRGNYAQPYDVFLGHYERGLTTAQVDKIFAALKPALISLLAAVNAHQDRVDDRMLHQPFPLEKQRELSLLVSTALGLDYKRNAALHVAPHPFCLQLARGDIRVTTRFYPDYFNAAFFGTLHETGHGLHGHGIAPELDGTFLSDMELYSQSVAESQSRTWENLVGRSREFWQWLFPKAKPIFPSQFADVDVEKMYRAVNRVRPQFIRVEADELTYNLHIMLRFEIEKELVEGKLTISEAPEAWQAKFRDFFGMAPATDREGILQDVHWSMGGIGAFVGYALGNLLSVQYYNQALAAHPTIPDEIAQGKFDTLRQWLTTNIYRQGRKYTLNELTQRVTGTDIQSHDYIAYLQKKFGEIYAL